MGGFESPQPACESEQTSGRHSWRRDIARSVEKFLLFFLYRLPRLNTFQFVQDEVLLNVFWRKKITRLICKFVSIRRWLIRRKKTNLLWSPHLPGPLPVVYFHTFFATQKTTFNQTGRSADYILFYINLHESFHGLYTSHYTFIYRAMYSIVCVLRVGLQKVLPVHRLPTFTSHWLCWWEEFRGCINRVWYSHSSTSFRSFTAVPV